MPDRDCSLATKVSLALSVLLVGADHAMAYSGPGAGISFSSSAKLLGVFLLAVCLAILLWPLYALLRWIRRDKHP